MVALALTACAGPPAAVSPSAASPLPSPTTLPQTPTKPVSPTEAACPVEQPWTIEFVVSGGFAGIEHRLEIDSTGAYQAQDAQTGTKVEGSLPAETMALLEAQLPALCGVGEAGRPPACADCFQYALEVTSGGATYSIVLNDVSLSQSTAAPLVGTLLQILNEALGP